MSRPVTSAHSPPGPSVPAAGRSILLRCPDGRCSPGRCQDHRKRVLQRSAATPEMLSSSIPPIVHDVLRSPGRPLDPTTQTQMEGRFGHDFGAVRVHTDARAGRSAEAVHALAYTVGSDVAFAPGRYAPRSPPGQRLIAHELTHVVQQRAGIASASSENALEVRARAAEAGVGGAVAETSRSEAHPWARSAGPRTLQRQAAPPAPPPAAGWTACARDEISPLNRELAEAVIWVSEAISDLQLAERPARTTGALGRYLSTDPAHVTNTILPRLRGILADLQRGATNFRCQTEQQCRARFPSGANAYSGNPVTLCPGYFEKAHLGRVTTLVHEAGHNAGLRGNVVEWQWPFPGLSVSTRLGNTESYAAFVRSNQYPALAPHQAVAGLGLRVGALFPGGADPRVVVTAEFDPILAQRIFRFVDLRLGLRVDVDARGSILAQSELGTRLFAPVSLSTTPLFLDLRGGLVVGRVADVGDRFERVEGLELNVVGASAEARIGFTTGRLGGSIGYRHIWDLMQRNPDIGQVTIGGEVRF